MAPYDSGLQDRISAIIDHITLMSFSNLITTFLGRLYSTGKRTQGWVDPLS
jgi:hypothetical protein